MKTCVNTSFHLFVLTQKDSGTKLAPATTPNDVNQFGIWAGMQQVSGF
jgi:hypothetical protein